MKGLILALIPMGFYILGYLTSRAVQRRKANDAEKYRALLTEIQRDAAQHIALGDSYAAIVFDQIDSALKVKEKA